MEGGLSAEHLGMGDMRPLAEDVLNMFSVVEAAAVRQLRSDGINAAGITQANIFTTPGLLGTLQNLAYERQQAAEVLLHEPAIARVQARTEQGQIRTYFICRVMPPTVAGALLVSYRAPAGRMASLEVGDEFSLPNGETIEICNVAHLRPTKHEDWDSIETRYRGDHGPYTIDSLLALLRGAAPAAMEDLVAAVLAEEQSSSSVLQGLRRAVITKMGLRDQPILDRFQDNLFRMSLDSRVLLLGPPGTGKTTTLIRRLGQKLESAQLDESERAAVARMEQDDVGSLAYAWVMFTPTRLLQQFVKEAFAREGVPASERHIRTWEDYRHGLARDHLKILRGPSTGGTFVLREAPILIESATSRPIAWFSAFDAWQKQFFLALTLKAAEDLAKAPDQSVAALAVRPLEILKAATPATVTEAVAALAEEAEGLLARAEQLKQQSDTQLRGALNLQLNRNREFLEQFATFLDTLKDTSDADPDETEEGEEGEDTDAEDADAPSEARTPKAAAIQAYYKSLRSLARARARKRQLRKGGRTAQIADWIGDRGLSAVALAEVGASLVMQSAARRVAQSPSRYVMGTPRRYRAFRRDSIAKREWYQPGLPDHRALCGQELDLVTLAMLREVAALILRAGVRRTIQAPAWAAVRAIRSQMRIQVLVDECTDFSALQLACMAALAHPETRSFFASGDFNQRLTTWGVRSEEDFRWACPDVASHRITIAYRQTVQLNELARGLVALFGGDASATSLPAGVDSSGVSPVLAERLRSVEETAPWLARRILEIAAFVKQLPSIGVLVSDEGDVEPMAHALQLALADENVAVQPCKDGQAVGTGEQVRVFDVKHIKGLEFEAVFFVGVDALAAREPGLFDKYLYVGATRAATYFGLACFDALPATLEPLRGQFADAWH